MGYDFYSIAPQQEHLCALKTDGTVWCSGANQYGQSGMGQGINAIAAPVKVQAVGNEAAMVTTAQDGTLVIKNDGSLWAFGKDTNCRFGLGSASCSVNAMPPPFRFSPVQASALGNDVIYAASGYDFACAVRSDGSLWCAGSNTYGQIQDPSLMTGSPSFVRRTDVPAILATSLSLGGFFGCAVTQDRSVVCWGANDYGQLGRGYVTSYPGQAPGKVALPAGNYSAVHAGSSNACATGVVHGGTKAELWCWGKNGRGELGRGTISTAEPTPQKMTLASFMPECGDGQCGVGEDSSTCAQDCGSQCGDNACTSGETCSACPADCQNSCAGLSCGQVNPCGFVCGTTCDAGCPGPTCTSLDPICGVAANGCGGTVSCTACTALTEAEPGNNSPSTATTVASGRTYGSHKLAAASDADWFKIAVAKTKTLVIKMRPPSDKNYNVEIYNTAGSSKLASPVYGGTGVVESVQYKNTTSSTVTYTIKVVGASASDYSTSPYYLKVTVQ